MFLSVSNIKDECVSRILTLKSSTSIRKILPRSGCQVQNYERTTRDSVSHKALIAMIAVSKRLCVGGTQVAYIVSPRVQR